MYHNVTNCIFYSEILSLLRMLCGPKYDGKYLRNLIRGLCGNRRFQETITHLLIPTYDIKTLEPQVFSTYEVVFNSLQFNTTRSS